MHTTKVVLKDGRTLEGFIWQFRPEEGYFTLGGISTILEQINFNDVASAITEDDRFIGDRDELRRARDTLKDGRKYGWWNPLPPIMDWERVIMKQ